MIVSELRIGNYVRLPDANDEGVMSVRWIGQFGVHLEGKYRKGALIYPDILTDKAEPIPITPEWLERLGFEIEGVKSFSEYFNKPNGKIKAYIINGVWFCSHFDWMCHKDAIFSKRGWYVGRRNTNQRYDGWNYAESGEVEYIHQLQNLYFALTGAELTVKEKV